MGVKLNQQQQKAVYSQAKNILVSAGAGSGKTEILRRRIMHLIENGLSFDNLVIITFTVASSYEMKKRISEAMPEKQNEILNAQIKTFDAFFLDFVKQFGYLLNINGNVSIISDELYQYLLLKITRKNLATILNDNPHFLKYYHAQNLHTLVTNIIDLYQKIINENQINHLDQYLTKDFLLTKIDELNDYLNTILLKITADQYLFAEEKIDITLLETLTTLSYENKIKFVNDHNNALKSILNKINKLKKYPEITVLKEHFINTKTKIDILTYQYFLDNSLIIVKILTMLIKKIDADLAQIKLTLNQFTYNDIMLIVLALLNLNDTSINNYLNNIKEIMIDEYQDTNYLQNVIINKMRQTDTTLFLVGDSKQAIYSFRNASPCFINEKLIQYENDQDSEVIYLNTNYRSSYEVINKINHIFSYVMTKDYGEIDYQAKHQLLAHQENQKQNSLFYIQYEQEDIPSINYLNNSDLSIFVENYLILSKIKTLLKNDPTLHYQDFCILSLKKSNFKYLKPIAQYFNLPISIQIQRDFNQHELVECIINILKLIINQDIKANLYGLLRSFLYQYQDQVIYQFLTQLQSSNWMEQLQKFNESIYNNLKILKQKNYNSNLETLLKTIFTLFPFKQQLATLEDENIDTVFEIFNQYLKTYSDNFFDITSFINVVDFLSYLEQFHLNYEENLNDDAINAMTIHKSKGLEFKHIFLLKFDAKTATDTNSFKFDQDLGYIVKLNKLTTISGFNALLSYQNPLTILYNQKQAIKNLHEKIRLLYVALTRAKTSIYIINPKTEENDKYNKFFDIAYENSVLIDDLKMCDAATIKEILYNKKQNTTLVYDKDLSFTKVQCFKKIIHINRPSRSEDTLLDANIKHNIELGDYIHRYLSQIDYLNLASLQNDDAILQPIINKMQQNDLFKNIINYYQEVQFIENNITGIIDLIVEKKDYFYIIDYKLNEIDKNVYKRQLQMYYQFLDKYVNKPIKMYLYSLLQGITLEVKPLKEENETIME